MMNLVRHLLPKIRALPTLRNKPHKSPCALEPVCPEDRLCTVPHFIAVSSTDKRIPSTQVLYPPTNSTSQVSDLL